MLPDHVLFSRYRSFEEDTVLPLKPITLLYGENNVGKSAALRLLPLLADSIDTRSSGPIELRSPAARGAKFRELTHNQRSRMDIGFRWLDGAEAKFELYWQEDVSTARRRAVVEKFNVKSLDNAEEWRWTGELSAEGSDIYSRSASEGGSAGDPRAIPFLGLLPSLVSPAVDLVINRLSSLSGQVQWLQARRAATRRRVAVPAGRLWRMQCDGEDAAMLLSSQPEIIATVSSWFEKHANRTMKVEVNDRSDEASVELVRKDGNCPPINLLDCGEGLQQILPVLTALSLLGRGPQAPLVLAIEEPEAHLHGVLQQGLADEIASTIKRVPSARVVIETHSPIFMTALQLAIATGDLNPKDVAICLVSASDEGTGSTLHDVSLSDHGEPSSDLLRDFFTTESQLSSSLLAMRLSKGWL